MNKTFSNCLRARGLKTLTAFAVAIGMTGSAFGAQFWVETGKKLRDSEYENWATTGGGEAFFTFGLPADYVSLVSAKMVFVSKDTKAMTYDVELAVSDSNPTPTDNPQPTGPIDTYTAKFEDLPSHGIEKDQIHELDLSDVLNNTVSLPPVEETGDFPDLNGGDYVTMKIKTDPGGDVRIMGLRVEYESTSSGGGNGLTYTEIVNSDPPNGVGAVPVIGGYEYEAICTGDNKVLGGGFATQPVSGITDVFVPTYSYPFDDGTVSGFRVVVVYLANPTDLGGGEFTNPPTGGKAYAICAGAN